MCDNHHREPKPGGPQHKIKKDVATKPRDSREYMQPLNNKKEKQRKTPDVSFERIADQASVGETS